MNHLYEYGFLYFALACFAYTIIKYYSTKKRLKNANLIGAANSFDLTSGKYNDQQAELIKQLQWNTKILIVVSVLSGYFIIKYAIKMILTISQSYI